MQHARVACTRLCQVCGDRLCGGRGAINVLLHSDACNTGVDKTALTASPFVQISAGIALVLRPCAVIMVIHTHSASTGRARES